MRYQSITEEQWATVTSAAEEAQQLKIYAVGLTKRLKALFDDDHPKKSWGVTFEILEDGTSWRIESPFGVARAHLRIFTNEAGMYAKYVIERQGKDPKDEPIWQQVWALHVTLQGMVHPGEEGGEPINLRTSSLNHSDDAMVHLGLSLLYALGQE
ncbi:hypothetical protein ACN1C3_09330 [Pseudomonas sp. H11T01]|uniref:hypothetical protein n=1 Tax=Pseudomonas sp. H11T01 TaxID=3402749 RepID=UPI003AD2FE67